jgi:SpoVK/Ycf46/Vps4 family AAA+-type ATPase
MALPFPDLLRTYIRAGYPILYVVTAEEDRAIELIGKALAEREVSRRKLYVWSVSRGLCTSELKCVDRKTADPNAVLPFLLEADECAVYTLLDFHCFFGERWPNAALSVRQLRDLVTPFKASRKTVILVSPVLRIPPELEKDITVLDLDMPGDIELAAVLDETVEQMKDNPKVAVRLEGDGREKIVKALTGLTRAEAENALAKAIVTNSRIDRDDVEMLLAEKEQIIRKSGTLEFYGTPERFGSIGGLDELKRWLRGRGRAFSEAARVFGLPSPKGLLLVGVPGCGKSLTAKSVAAEWKMPLLKFDLGKVFGSFVGQSEENMRRAMKTAEAVAPCVMWIDEIEKGLAGSRGQSGDSGTATRVFGTLLTWMEENRKQVFTIATANDIDGLPPELLRKGRFDEIFFIDLPTPRERATILAIHLTKHDRDYRDFDLRRHADAAEEFSGAELEQVVVSALYDAFSEGETARLEDRHIDRAISESLPLARSVPDKIARLRDEARHKWRPASLGGEGDGAQDIAIAEAVPAPRRPKRIFEV